MDMNSKVNQKHNIVHSNLYFVFVCMRVCVFNNKTYKDKYVPH